MRRDENLQDPFLGLFGFRPCEFRPDVGRNVDEVVAFDVVAFGELMPGGGGGS